MPALARLVRRQHPVRRHKQHVFDGEPHKLRRRHPAHPRPRLHPLPLPLAEFDALLDSFLSGGVLRPQLLNHAAFRALRHVEMITTLASVPEDSWDSFRHLSTSTISFAVRFPRGMAANPSESAQNTRESHGTRYYSSWASARTEKNCAQFCAPPLSKRLSTPRNG